MKTILLLIALALVTFTATAQITVSPAGGGGNWNASGSTNSSLTGNATVNSLTATNGITSQGTLTLGSANPTIQVGSAQNVNGTLNWLSPQNFYNSINLEQNVISGVTTLADAVIYTTNVSFCLQTNIQPSSQSTNLTPNMAASHIFYYLATNNVYLSTPTGIPSGGTNATYTFLIQQDTTGSRTLNVNTTYWKFPGGTVPTLTTTTNSVDVLTFIVNAQGTAFYGTSALNMK